MANLSLSYLILAACALLLVQLELTASQRVFQASRPVLTPPFAFCFRENKKTKRVVRYISDQQTKCQYWECAPGRIVRKTCGLQTFISEFYEGDDYNPCTETYVDLSQQFDCTRKGYDPDGTPTCLRIYKERNVCKNGGEVTSQGNLCWCECPKGYRGFECELTDEKEVSGTIVEGAEGTNGTSFSANFGGPPDVPFSNSDILRSSVEAIRQRNLAVLTEFAKPNLVPDDMSAGKMMSKEPSKPEEEVEIGGKKEAAEVENAKQEDNRNSVAAPPVSVREDGKFLHKDPCPGGKAPEDFCANLPPEKQCKNNGVCVNQCLGAVCQCKPPFTAGRRCEQYRCVVNVECMNGGTCRRGPTGRDSVATCDCLPGFEGSMCETISQDASNF